ncbi:hypothetical protein HORIV_21440 [Vreelandella olivaria]|uniref:Uncharacterized protein n=1 Tax=Vreelandella olivaria TaxID=390919 RepID=A0ABM7GGI8_9GAMM|nr:hypothetical protein HORIV_21440 [Halomonas olivaria]
MSDFHQNGIITDFHNLTRRSVEALEQELCQFARRRPMGLILPSLFSELEGPALSAIVDELVKSPISMKSSLAWIGLIVSNSYMPGNFSHVYPSIRESYGTMAHG